MEINKDEPVIVGSGMDDEPTTKQELPEGPRMMVQLMTGKDIIGKLREEIGVRPDGKGITSDS